jgi:hypothetical protein
LIAQVVAGLVGAWLIGATALSALQTLAVPGATRMRITRWVFFGLRVGLDVVGRALPGARRGQLLAIFAPLGLVTLPAAWLVLVLTGFTLVYWSLGVHPMSAAVVESGSSLFTLGFRAPVGLPATLATFVEAGLGLGLVALLISYLPAIYGSYSRREALVTALEAQAGSPPSAVEMLERFARIDGLGQMDEMWREWSRWFGDIEETHSSAPSLVFFRSPQPDRSWVTAAGAVLDAASIVASTVDQPRQPDAELCVRAGYLCLRRIADYFGMPYDPAPAPGDPVSIRRGEFDQACTRLAAAGVPLRADRDQAWRDFAGWRVNYDTVLLRFASLCAAPAAPWSADRPIPFRLRPLRRRYPPR